MVAPLSLNHLPEFTYPGGENKTKTLVSIAKDSGKSINSSATHNIYKQNLPKMKVSQNPHRNHHSFPIVLKQSLDTLLYWIRTQANEDVANISCEYHFMEASDFILATSAGNSTK
ncbi:hypothetical protein PHYBLDRAFT_173780 [Phycomyces blakesleeanus NRRL 1555(-)]|uniref:Uncharacterized protein n=1 Tax=Phycomyces blakesleeanus (strain ATCC 8743b / DSM 1359 / FGSC 10004 / NBRC 33097 / NRRL 1555) TaxID=763407 RepID=A0A162N2P3_PHYB8|nr:hypothetical protein PHYBLDRAFT_173780 [Phycomyces blakesleeanus NRRL 1555(-)]OAD67868.1 hypothetical protein PHYBLDRAFT_173780 [Phycomyces blakesleeanus NRRL 1555(-)]|eukprot:XP_018285908.1 hypothetical protein PHYBLDRAFT_173780 [Phycomyces blakesleeanus NRRL 1555(-)]